MITREEFEALTQKVERLEAAAAGARQRGWMVGMAGAAALAVALLVGGRGSEAQKPPPPVGTKLKAPLTVVGNVGQTLLRVTQGPTGAVVQVCDNNGSQLARIADDGPLRGICSFDDTGILATFAGVEDEGGGVLDREFAVHKVDGDKVAELVRSESATIGNLTGTVVFDDDGGIRVFNGIEPFDSNLGLSTFDPDGDPQVALGNQGSLGGRPALALFGSDTQDGGVQALVESQLATGGHVELFDPAGTSTFSAP
jgi:hypothetical protein